MNRQKEKRRRRLRRKFRIKKNIQGTAKRPRATIYKSNRYTYIQVIDDSRGATLAAASNLEKELRAINNNRDNLEKLGQVLGKRLKEKRIKQIVFDRNGYLYHGVVKSVADGIRESGIRF